MNKFIGSIKTYSLFSLLFLVLSAASLKTHGQNLFNEDFNFSGALTSNGYTAHSGGGTNAISTTTGLSYNGYIGTAVGNAALIGSAGGEDINKTFTSQSTNGQSIYISFLASIPSSLAADKAGDYFFHSGSPGGASWTTFSARVFAKYTNSSGAVNFGLSNNGTPTYGTTNFSKGVTYLIVIKYTIATGATNDPVSLWVIPSGIPASEAAAGTAEVVNTTTPGTDALSAIGLRQGSATASVPVIVDGIRVGNTWSDAVTGGFTGTITGAATATAFSTTYGTASAAQSFTVSGTGLTAAITATAPTGFEVSSDGSAYGSTAAISQSSGSASGTVYVRLAATAPVNGTYNGKNIVLSSAGCASVNIATAASGNAVSKKELTITAGNQSVSYGTAASAVTAAGTYTLNGFVNSETSSVVSGSVTFTTDYTATDNAGTTGRTITPVVTGLTATNYSFTAVAGSITVNKANQTISFSTIADKLDTDAPFTLNGTASSGLAVSYSSSNTSVATVSGNTVTITGVGVTTITASQDGDGNYNAAASVSRTLNVSGTSMTNQTITFGALAAKTYGDAPFTLNGTASSGLTVSYSSSNAAVATVSGSTVTIVGPGTTDITASQSGNSSYNPAPNVSQTLSVSAKNLTISGVTVDAKTYNGTTAAVLNLSAAILNGKVTGDAVTVSGGGVFDDANAGYGIGVTANLTLNGSDAYKYTLTQPVNLFGDIYAASQTITFGAIPSQTYSPAGTYTLTGSASSGLPVSYLSPDASVISINNNIVTILGAGSAVITASQSGDGNYDPAADVTQTLVVNKANQTITFLVIPNKLTTDTPFTLTATSSSGLAVTYASSNTSVATVSGSTVTIVGGGTTTITASQTGDGNYNAAADVPRTLTVQFPVIVGWDVSAATSYGVSPYAPSVADANLNVVGLTRGSGVVTTGSATGRAWGGTGFYSTLDSNINFNRFITFSVNPKSGYAASFNQVNPFYYRRSSTGPSYGVLQISFDGSTYSTIGSVINFSNSNSSGASIGAIDLSSVTSLQNVPSAKTVTFRLVPYGATGLGGTFYIYDYGSSTALDLGITGAVASLPPPSITSALTASGTVASPFTYNITATNSPTSFGATGLPAGLTLNGTTGVISGSPSAAGSYTVTMTVNNGAGTDSKDLLLTINKAGQTISFGSLAAKTYGDAPFTLNGTATSGLTVSYSSSNTAVATVSGNTVTIVGAGSAIITASQSGDDNYNAAASVDQVLVVNKANQTITFAPLGDKQDTDAPYTLVATASSGLPVSFSSSNAAVIIVAGSTAMITGSGTSAITASQAGDDNYNAATPVSRDQVVLNTALLDQTITFGTLASKVYGDAAFTLNGTASSGLTVSYSSSNTAVATVSGNTVTITGPGTTQITASQSGNSSYNQAPFVTQSLVVSAKTITISGVTVDPKTYDGGTAASLNVSAAALIGVVSGDVVTVGGGGVFDDANAGYGIAVTANLILGGADAFKYTLTQPVNLFGDIAAASQTITFNTIPAQTYSATGTYTLSATASSGLAVSYASSDLSVATINNNIVSIVGGGTAVITASQSGNNNYDPAPDVTQDFVVNKAAQTITFAALSNKVTSDPPFSLTGTASSGLLLSYASSNAAVAAVSGNTVTLTGGIGVTTITASQDGDNNYAAATPVSRTLTVTAPVLLGWDLFGQNSPVTFAANFANEAVDTASARNLLTRGATAASSTGSNSFRTIGFQNNGIAITNTDYFQVTIKPKTGKILSLNSLRANLAGTASFAALPGVKNQFAYSLDGTNFAFFDTGVVTIGTPATLAIDVSAVSALQNLGSSATVTLRYYASGQTNSGGWGFISAAAGIYGLSINGLASDIPPPVINSSLSASGTVGSSFNYTVTASNSPTSFSATGLPSGLTLNGTSGVISGTPAAAGSYVVSITAANNSGSDTKDLALTIGQANQTITFGALASKTYGDPNFTLNGTAGSGLTVSYSSSNTAVATVSGNTVTIVGAGSTVITASQAGDANYFAAASVDQTLTVNKANQTITFGALADKLDSDAPFALTATASSGLPVSYSSSNTSVISISGATATITGSGLSIITASQDGNDNYNPAVSVNQNQNVINTALADQTISFGALSQKVYGDAPFTLTGSASSGLTVTYASSNTAVATVSGDVVTIVGPGTIIITAAQAGNSTYNPAPAVSQNLVVDKKTLTVTGAAAQDKLYDGNTNAVITGATLNGIVGNDVVTVSGGGTFADANAGTSISVTSSLVLGGADAGKYYFQQPSGLSANISKASQTITFSAIAPKTTSSIPFTLNGNASSGLAVSYSSSNTAVATVSGNTVTITGSGVANITASQSGNNNYQAAADVVQILTVSQDPTYVTWTFSNGSVADSFPVGGAAVVPGITISSLSRGNNFGSSALIWSNSNSSGYSGASGSFNAGAALRNGSLDKDTTTYFSFTITPDVNKRVKLDSMFFGSRSTSTGPKSFAVRTSLDNFSSSIAIDSAINNSSWYLKKPLLSSVRSGYNSPITFRIYGFANSGNSTSGTVNWRIDDIKLGLFVENCPNPVNAGVISGSNSICPGSTASLSSNGDAGGTWSSSNTAVATVDASGLVTAVSAGDATITYTVTGTCGSQSATKTVSVATCSSLVSVKAFIQGYYNNGVMGSALMNSGVAGASSTQCDTIIIEIHDGVNGNLIGSPVKTILSTDGTAQAVFPALSGSHYIVLKHRSALETWSAAPVVMGTAVSYDFSTAASQAYGSNQVNVGTSGAPVFALYMGDFDRDGYIGDTDYSIMEAGILSVPFGYDPRDLNGDGVVESADYSLMGNNILQGIMVAKP